MIELNGISKTYTSKSTSEVKALDDVSLNIKQGEFVAIQGPSGSGKSTLMNIIGFLDTPSSGSYRLNEKLYDNKNTNDLARIRNEHIGFVFQSFNLLKNSNALDNVSLPLIYSKSDSTDDKALDALKAVGLADRAKHRPFELSGGQQQRVAIARALVNDPQVILADEPTGNLDSKSSAEIMNIFKSLHDEGRTIIMVTHEDDVAQTAGRQIRIVDGKIVSDN